MSHTAILPILSEDMLAAWQQAGNHELLARVHLSDSHQILGGGHIRENDLRVWRQGVPQESQNYIRAALSATGPELTLSIDRYLSAARILTLDKDKICGQDNDKRKIDISADGLVEAWRGIKLGLSGAESFATHIFSTLTKFLSVMPAGTCLELDRQTKEKFNATCVPVHCPHPDGFNNLILHFSDPGTPYINGCDPFRCQEGDVTYHGSSIRHGHATAPTIKSLPRPRACIGFRVLPRHPFGYAHSTF